MKSVPPPPDSLLAAVLGETASDEFRAALLAETLRRAQNRRRLRCARAFAGVLVVPLLFATWLLSSRRPGPLPPPATPTVDLIPAFTILRTRPAIAPTVATRPLPESQRIETMTLAGPALVRTDRRHSPLLIDDAELLALAAPRHAALVRLGPGVQRLVFGDGSAHP